MTTPASNSVRPEITVGHITPKDEIVIEQTPRPFDPKTSTIAALMRHVLTNDKPENSNSASAVKKFIKDKYGIELLYHNVRDGILNHRKESSNRTATRTKKKKSNLIVVNPTPIVNDQPDKPKSQPKPHARKKKKKEEESKPVAPEPILNPEDIDTEYYRETYSLNDLVLTKSLVRRLGKETVNKLIDVCAI